MEEQQWRPNGFEFEEKRPTMDSFGFVLAISHIFYQLKKQVISRYLSHIFPLYQRTKTMFFVRLSWFSSPFSKPTPNQMIQLPSRYKSKDITDITFFLLLCLSTNYTNPPEDQPPKKLSGFFSFLVFEALQELIDQVTTPAEKSPTERLGGEMLLAGGVFFRFFKTRARRINLFFWYIEGKLFYIFIGRFGCAVWCSLRWLLLLLLLLFSLLLLLVVVVVVVVVVF